LSIRACLDTDALGSERSDYTILRYYIMCIYIYRIGCDIIQIGKERNVAESLKFENKEAVYLLEYYLVALLFDQI
jgi:hypothetical protein